MKLLLKRIARKKTYTIGKLYVDGVYVGDTMEDRDRFYFGEKKVYGETAIPCGTYDITMNVYSPKFGAKYFYKNLCKGYLPRLQNVPQFNGVLIHCGNSEKDSLGCIIVGLNKVAGKVVDSQKTYTNLMKEHLLIAKERNEHITITIQ